MGALQAIQIGIQIFRSLINRNGSHMPQYFDKRFNGHSGKRGLFCLRQKAPTGKGLFSEPRRRRGKLAAYNQQNEHSY